MQSMDAGTRIINRALAIISLVEELFPINKGIISF